MRHFLTLIHRFRHDERGVFAVIFAILAIVLVATAGAVVDFTTIEQARARAQDALDSAALGLQSTIHEAGVTEETIMVRAQALLIERLADANVSATVYDVEIDTTTGMLRLRASLDIPTAFVALVGIDQVTAGVTAEARRGVADIEVALALDVTGSMAGSRLEALKDATEELIELVVQDVQTPNYSKVALAPYSNSVNVGSYADDVRGPVTGYTDVTAANWLTAGSGYSRTISAINKASPARITTSSNHGFTTGDIVNITNVAGGGFTALNGNSYTITVVDSTRFTLNGTSSSGFGGTYTSNSGRVTTGGTRVISAVTKANPGQITTTMPHGFASGDRVYLQSAAGGGFTALNDKSFVITVQNTTQFLLSGIDSNTSGYWGTYTVNSGIVRKCLTNECEVVITSAAHGFGSATPPEYVYITNSSVGTLTYLQSIGGDLDLAVNQDWTTSNDIPGMIWEVTDATANTYVLENSSGPLMGAYAAGGRSYCTLPGCQYHFFDNAGWGTSWNLHQISSCVSERVNANQYTDQPPSTTYVGRVYPPASGNTCITNEIMPLSTDKAALIAEVESFVAVGSTAGQIGTAWAWYLVSPEFAYLWPSASQPADYDEPNLLKVVVIMTDGAYNTPYCNGVIAADATSGSGAAADHINCNATNGNPFTQAASLCTAMKAEGVIVYTVGLEVGSNTTIVNMLTNCATSAAHAYLANNGSALIQAFQDIANSISELRLAQ